MESNYNISVYRGAGAIGRFEVLLSTGRELASFDISAFNALGANALSRIRRLADHARNLWQCTAEKETYSSFSLPDFRTAERIAHVHGDQQRCARLAYPDVEPLPSPSVTARSALLTRTVVMHCLSNLPSTHVHANTAETHKVAVTRVSPVCQGRNVSVTHRKFCVRPSMSHARRNTAAQAVMQQTAAPTVDQVNTKTLLCTSVTANTFDQALDEIHQISKAGADLIELRLDMLTDFNVEEHLQQLLNTTNTPKLVTMRPVWEG